MHFMPAASLKEVYTYSGNSDLSTVMFGSARSRALFSIATLPIRINTDSSLGMAVLMRVTLRKSLFCRLIQLWYKSYTEFQDHNSDMSYMPCNPHYYEASLLPCSPYPTYHTYPAHAVSTVYSICPVRKMSFWSAARAALSP